MKNFEHEEQLENGNYKLEVSPEVKSFLDHVMEDLPQVVSNETKCYYEKASFRPSFPMIMTPPFTVRKALDLKN